jgi:hyperosmotically inducible protein
MYFSRIVTITGLAAALFVPATVTSSFAAQATSKASVAVDDSTLKTRVEASIKAKPTLKNQNIDVSVAGGVATLTGYVQTAARKTSASRAAKVAGVARVDNQLMVDPSKGKELDDKIVDATKTGAKKTGEAAKTVGEKTKDAAVATGSAITDATISTMIHTKMVGEDTLKGSDISVDVTNHVVTLKGTVASAAGKTRAEQIARTTEGVKSVRDTLMIGPKK